VRRVDDDVVEHRPQRGEDGPYLVRRDLLRILDHGRVCQNIDSAGVPDEERVQEVVVGLFRVLRQVQDGIGRVHVEKHRDVAVGEDEVDHGDLFSRKADQGVREVRGDRRRPVPPLVAEDGEDLPPAPHRFFPGRLELGRFLRRRPEVDLLDRLAEEVVRTGADGSKNEFGVGPVGEGDEIQEREILRHRGNRLDRRFGGGSQPDDHHFGNVLPDDVDAGLDGVRLPAHLDGADPLAQDVDLPDRLLVRLDDQAT
jgi:hypothetical protein